MRSRLLLITKYTRTDARPGAYRPSDSLKTAASAVTSFPVCLRVICHPPYPNLRQMLFELFCFCPFGNACVSVIQVLQSHHVKLVRIHQEPSWTDSFSVNLTSQKWFRPSLESVAVQPSLLFFPTRSSIRPMTVLANQTLLPLSGTILNRNR